MQLFYSPTTIFLHQILLLAPSDLLSYHQILNPHYYLIIKLYTLNFNLINYFPNFSHLHNHLNHFHPNFYRLLLHPPLLLQFFHLLRLIDIIQTLQNYPFKISYYIFIIALIPHLHTMPPHHHHFINHLLLLYFLNLHHLIIQFLLNHSILPQYHFHWNHLLYPPMCLLQPSFLLQYLHFFLSYLFAL